MELQQADDQKTAEIEQLKRADDEKNKVIEQLRNENRNIWDAIKKYKIVTRTACCDYTHSYIAT